MWQRDVIERGWTVRAHGHQQPDRCSENVTSDGSEDVGRRAVDPMHVIGDHQHRRRARQSCDEGDGGGGHTGAARRTPTREPETDAQRVAVPWFEDFEEVAEGVQELVQAPETDLSLPFCSAHLKDTVTSSHGPVDGCL